MFCFVFKASGVFLTVVWLLVSDWLRTVSRAADGEFGHVVTLVMLYAESGCVGSKSKKLSTVCGVAMPNSCSDQTPWVQGSGCVYTGYKQRRLSWCIFDTGSFSHI